jgi:hypothetical protein
MKFKPGDIISFNRTVWFVLEAHPQPNWYPPHSSRNKYYYKVRTSRGTTEDFKYIPEHMWKLESRIKRGG